MCSYVDSGLKPLIKHAGGKRRLLPQLLPLLPPSQDIQCFVEPMCGGASMFLALNPPRAILGDTNADVMCLYNQVRDAPEPLMRALDAHQPHVADSTYYYNVRARDPQPMTSVDRAARTVFLNKTCFNGLWRVNRAGQFNTSFGQFKRPPTLYDATHLMRVSQALQRAELYCGDFEQTLRSAPSNSFCFIDAPYVPVSATSNFVSYGAAGFTEVDQRRLARVAGELTARGCRVMLTNSDAPLVRELYRDYDVQEIRAPRSINSRADRRGCVTELVLRNYTTP